MTMIETRLVFLLKENKIKDLTNYIKKNIITVEQAKKIYEAAK